MRRCISCQTEIQDGWSCPECKFAPVLLDGFVSFAPQLMRADQFHNPTDFAALSRLEAGNFWFRARNRLITWAIRRYFAAPREILEIGCGTGFVLSGIRAAFPEAQISGSEASCVGLGFAARRVPEASLFQMDARNIPFTAEFDVIGAFDVLEHVREDEQVLEEMFRAAKSGGGIVLTVPQHPFLWTGVDEAAGHVRRYEAAELAGKVARAGFRIVRSTSFVALLLPLMAASRLGRGAEGGRRVASAELALPPLLDWLMEQVLRLEHGFIRLGVSLPAGGSRLLVARKP